MLNFTDLTITLPHWLKPLMTTDPTELQDTQSLRRRDEGFTQTWDTVGTGINSCAERASPSLKRRSAMR